MAKILLVEDEQNLLKTLELMLKKAGHEVEGHLTGQSALESIRRAAERRLGLDFDIVLTDFRLGDATGIEVLKATKAADASTQVLLMTAHATTSTAVEAMREGAYDYIEKPFKRDALLVLIDKALEKRMLMRENVVFRAQAGAPAVFSNVVMASRAMQDVVDMVVRVAPTKANILITGESGTGKEVIARAIHQLSAVSTKPFVAVNCGAIPESLIESEFFGYVKGAFTGAVSDKMGFFLAANGGTIFLDEVGELPLNMQVKLLRAIQERKIQPVGSTKEIAIDIRIIAATNRDLREEVNQKRFREDLFFRLNVIQVALPPLRERQEDIPRLVHYFIKKYNAELGKSVRDAAEDVMDQLVGYSFPGNVRELENIIEHAMTLEMSDRISLASLPKSFHGTRVLGEEIDEEVCCGDVLDVRARSRALALGDSVDLEALVASIERSLIEQALVRAEGNKTEAAKLLGISFRSFRYRLKKYDMDA